MKLPIRLLGLVAAGLLIGTALAPVAAQQQQSGVDGQVAVRSDGAAYLISGGVRRWIAAVPISDDDLNAYPEGDPIYVGLGPPGAAGSTTASAPSSPSSSATSAKPATPAPASSPQPSTSSGSSSSSSSSSAQPTATPDSGASTNIPIEVNILDSDSKTFQAGDKISIDLKTTKDNVCELSVKWPDDTEDNEDSTTADSRGRCHFNVEVPDNMKDGPGKVKGWSRTGGQYNRADVDIQIKNKS
jgi:hypothetical protein